MNAFGLILYLAWWAGVVLLVVWFYQQFAKKPAASLLAWGLGLTILVLALWCGAIWINMPGQAFGGWSTGYGGMWGMMTGRGFQSQ